METESSKESYLWTDSTNLKVIRHLPGESEVITELTERDAKTVLRATITYTSQEIRDAVIRSGVEHGAAESYDRLAELLEAQAFAAPEGVEKP